MEKESDSPSITVYGHPYSRANRVVWLLKELDLPHIVDSIDFFDDQHDDKNGGNRRVPFLTDAKTGAKIFESLAINTWLIQTYGAESALAPRSAREWAELIKWSFWTMTEVDPLLFEGLMYNEQIGHIISRPSNYQGYFDRMRSESRRDRIGRELQFPFQILESTLRDSGDWLMGDRFTATDLNVASVAFWVFLQEPSQAQSLSDGFPEVLTWLNRCMEREHSPWSQFLRDQASANESALIDWSRAADRARERSKRAGPLSRSGGDGVG